MKWYQVRIFWPDEVYEDEIRGLSPEHALRNAYKNWQDAEKIVLY